MNITISQAMNTNYELTFAIMSVGVNIRYVCIQMGTSSCIYTPLSTGICCIVQANSSSSEL